MSSSSLFDFDRRLDTFAVMGNPIKHSKSPSIHRLFAKQTGKNISYNAIQVDLGGFQQAVGNFHANGGKGLNITVPFKHEAWQIADTLSNRAKLAKAVNTLYFQDDGSRFGDNTDGAGLVTDIKKNIDYDLKDKKILILGAGGAVSGILPSLLEQHPKQIHLVNRTLHKAVDLIHNFPDQNNLSAGEYSTLDAQGTFDLIINGTASSLYGELPPLTASLIKPNQTLCYDLMYASLPTEFMNWGKEAGAGQCVDGLGMLVEQAAESFYLWMKIKPKTTDILKQLRQQLSP